MIEHGFKTPATIFNSHTKEEEDLYNEIVGYLK
jgi:hypothetical protein